MLEHVLSGREMWGEPGREGGPLRLTASRGEWPAEMWVTRMPGGTGMHR